MPAVKLIKTTLEDIQDYMRFRAEEANKLPLTKAVDYVIKNYYNSSAHKETEADYAQKSFNEFIKYRYYTSKLDAASVQQDEDNVEYIADISFLDLSEGINLEGADFSKTFAIGANFSNCNLHCANFKEAILPFATFNESVVAYVDFTNAVLSYSNVGNNYGAPIMGNAAVTALNGFFYEMPQLGLPSLQNINIVNSLANHTAQTVQAIHDNYASITGKVIESVNTATNGVNGLLLGGLGGFTLTNLSLAALAPAIGLPVAINLSVAGTVLGAMEGVNYKLGYSTSIINNIVSKVNGFNKPVDAEVNTPHLLSEEDGYANVTVIDAGSMDATTLELLVNYSQLPVFKVGNIANADSDWQLIDASDAIPPMPELIDAFPEVDYSAWEMVESPLEAAVAPEELNDDLSWEMV